MIKSFSIGILISFFLFITCIKDIEPEEDMSYEYKISPYIIDTTSRATSKTLKGHILFSWKNNQNGWNYSIAPNLNSIPASDNVGTSNTFSGEECLKYNLKFFAEGEEFYWHAYGDLETLEGKTVNLSYPPDNIIENIEDFCDELNLVLIIDN